MAVVRHLFAYGSLMSGELLRAVCGRQAVGEPASLHDHVRYRLHGEDYPAVVAQRGSLVHGVLYRNLAPRQWRRLDAFEGELYRRRTVMVQLSSGDELRAYCYLLHPRYAVRLQRSGWDYEEFLTHHQRTLLAALRRR